MLRSIEALATVFRCAIEASDDVRLDIVLGEFPRGACGDASLLLAEFLRQHGFDRIEYVFGWDRRDPTSPKSHAWLEVDGVIVDITADQFETEPAAPVFVTRKRRWHARFQRQERSEAEIDGFDAGRLWMLFARVLEQVPKSLGGAA